MNKKYKVTNRSQSQVIYNLPEFNIRREFAPGEARNIEASELEHLSFQPGGGYLMANYLMIEPIGLEELQLTVEPEYKMTAEQVKEFCLTSSYPAFLDCLDFAPAGVIDLVKKYCVELPINDVQKRAAVKEKTGFDIDKAIDIMKMEQEERAKAGKTNEVQGRRVQTDASVSTSTGRRVAPPAPKK